MKMEKIKRIVERYVKYVKELKYETKKSTAMALECDRDRIFCFRCRWIPEESCRYVLADDVDLWSFLAGSRNILI